MHTHGGTRQLLCHLQKGSAPPISQGRLWMPLNPITSGEGGEAIQPLFPPDSTPTTFSTSLLPSFASPVNAIKHTSMPDLLGT